MHVQNVLIKKISTQLQSFAHKNFFSKENFKHKKQILLKKYLTKQVFIYIMLKATKKLVQEV